MVDILSKGLRVERALSEAEWIRLGREIAVRGRGWQWQVGDWWALRDGEVTAEVLKVLDELGVDLKTVRNWAAVCKAIPLEERVEGLSLSHHREVVGLPPEERRALLEEALRKGWTVQELRDRVRPSRARPGRVEVALKDEDGPEEEAEPVREDPLAEEVGLPRRRAASGPTESFPEPEAWEPAASPARAEGRVVPSPEGDGYEYAGYPETRVVVRNGRILLWNPSVRMTPDGARRLAEVLLVVAELVEREVAV